MESVPVLGILMCVCLLRRFFYGKKKLSKGKIVLRVLLGLLAVLVVFLAVVFTVNKIMLSKEKQMLIDAGYYNPVSVGDYSLNVYKYGNESGKHNIVAISGMGVSDFSVDLQLVTDQFSDDNQIIFVDRAGYGLSDDTKTPQTVEQIVNDYRTALKNDGIEAPYVLLPHSIGGIYANYWVSEYPDEIEGIVFLDGTQLDGGTTVEEENSPLGYKMELAACKLGLYRLVADSYIYPLTEDHTEDEQELSFALKLRTGWNYALDSENALVNENCLKTWNIMKANDVPKVYICSSWGYTTEEEIVEDVDWMNAQLARAGKEPIPQNPEIAAKLLESCAEAREETLIPYMEKMGNCELILLGGDHFIFQQKPNECAEIIMNFLDGLDN